MTLSTPFQELKISDDYANTPAILSEKHLRNSISNYPKILDKRIQYSLDELSIEFIEAAELAVVASSSPENNIFPIYLGESGASIRDIQHISLHKSSTPTLSFDTDCSLYASMYFIVPQIGHGLRLNGVIQEDASDCYTFTIEQVYFHCARAAARSELWTFKPAVNITNLDPKNFIKLSPFLLLKTINHLGKTEISPRGDQPGFVKMLDDKTLLLPERPGNKIAVSLRNIINQAHCELFFMLPGSNLALTIAGKAKVISDIELLKQCAVNGKVPKVGMLLTIESSNLQGYRALETAQIWRKPSTQKPELCSFSKALATHMNGTGLLGKTTAVVIGKVVKHDMKNLY